MATVRVKRLTKTVEIHADMVNAAVESVIHSDCECVNKLLPTGILIYHTQGPSRLQLVVW